VPPHQERHRHPCSHPSLGIPPGLFDHSLPVLTPSLPRRSETSSLRSATRTLSRRQITVLCSCSSAKLDQTTPVRVGQLRRLPVGRRNLFLPPFLPLCWSLHRRQSPPLPLLPLGPRGRCPKQLRSVSIESDLIVAHLCRTIFPLRKTRCLRRDDGAVPRRDLSPEPPLSPRPSRSWRRRRLKAMKMKRKRREGTRLSKRSLPSRLQKEATGKNEWFGGATRPPPSTSLRRTLPCRCNTLPPLPLGHLGGNLALNPLRRLQPLPRWCSQSGDARPTSAISATESWSLSLRLSPPVMRSKESRLGTGRVESQSPLVPSMTATTSSSTTSSCPAGDLLTSTTR
jgi:hypothetical protein